jgi:hypothetical protein
MDDQQHLMALDDVMMMMRDSSVISQRGHVV